MKHNLPQGHHLDKEAFAALDVKLDELTNQNLKGQEEEFVTEMYERRQKYGDQMYISEKQLAWLERIHDRVVRR